MVILSIFGLLIFSEFQTLASVVIAIGWTLSNISDPSVPKFPEGQRMTRTPSMSTNLLVPPKTAKFSNFSFNINLWWP